jgi:two-component system response regulator PilR (NtrC family)
VQCRVIAATNRDVQREVNEGRFREDLYYRVNVINLHMPPLRDRPEDIPLLAEHFLTKHAAVQDKRLTFSPDAMRFLVSRSYRGNVRELENLVERAVTLAVSGQVELVDLDLDGTAQPGATPRIAVEIPDTGLDLDGYLAEVERRILVAALERTGGVRKDAAQLLGTTFRSLRYRLAKYGLGDGEDEESDEERSRP